jgi:hypothetical protein
MRTTMVKWYILAVLLLGGAAMGQEGDPAGPKKPAEEKKPSQLEELIAQALRDNPDVRVAEAKVQGAEAELSRARLQVIQKIVAHQHTIETLESAVKVAEANYTVNEARFNLAEADFKRMTALSKANSVSRAELDQAQANRDQARAGVETAKAALQASKADLAKAQAELPYLLGKGTKDDKQAETTRHALEWLRVQRGGDTNARALSDFLLAQAQGAGKAGEQPRGTIAEKLRKALDTPVALKFGLEEVPLDDLLAYLKGKVGIPIVETLPRDLLGKKYRVSLDNVPLGAAFQAVEDVAGVQFAVRDYGILVSDKLPSGVTRLHDFWKESDKPKASEEKPKSSGRNPPPGKVEGKIIRVEEGSGLVEISIGSDDGLSEGQTMEVYRTGGDKGARYLGSLRIEKTSAGNAVGKFTNKLNAPVEVGDFVSSKFFVD